MANQHWVLAYKHVGDASANAAYARVKDDVLPQRSGLVVRRQFIEGNPYVIVTGEGPLTRELEDLINQVSGGERVELPEPLRATFVALG